jgi:hypothetical protein
MKRTTIYFTFILLFCLKSIHAQCEAAFLATAPPLPVDNSGNTTNFIVMFNNEYTTLSGLNIGETYTISNPNTTLFLTLRNANDNSVIISGNTPLMFTTSVTKLKVHLFISSSCPTSDPAGLFYPLAATNETALGVKEETFNDHLKVFPNPSSEKIRIASNLKITGIEVYTIGGKLKQRLKVLANKKEIDISSFENGVYFIKINSDSKYSVKKIIKI